MPVSIAGKDFELTRPLRSLANVYVGFTPLTSSSVRLDQIKPNSCPLPSLPLSDPVTYEDVVELSTNVRAYIHIDFGY